MIYYFTTCQGAATGVALHVYCLNAAEGARFSLTLPYA